MTRDDVKAPKLTSILCRVIAFAATLAVIAQAGLCLSENFGDEDYFFRNYIKTESDRIVRNAIFTNSDVSVDFSGLNHYRQEHADKYSFRIIDAGGRSLAGSNEQILNQVSPLQTGRAPLQQWLQRLDTGKWFHAAGGITSKIGDRAVWVEVATLGDPAYLRMSALLHELLLDVIMPMGPLVILAIALTVVSVNRSLRPLIAAARKADGINAAHGGVHFDLQGLPREAASFASAINHLIDRVAELADAQTQLIARAAHELRTPLAVMMLELGNVSDARARQLEKDVADMSETISRLLTLARLDSIGLQISERIDLVALAVETIERFKPWAASRGTALNLKVNEPAFFEGDSISIREAIRNLVENAIKHTPAGATIQVGCGPGSSIVVEDNGPGISDFEADDLFKPFKTGKRTYDGEGAGLGLAIVKQAVALHKGSIEVGRSALGGARFSLKFI
jgi:signal transduction histidine kinase